VQGHSLEVQGMVGRSRSAAEIALLHESLGSVSHWRDFRAGCQSQRICRYGLFALGLRNSDLVAEPRPVSYMHDEALHALPDLLAQLPIKKPIRVGHSGGGSMALIDAGAHDRVRGRVLLAPHVFVEDLSLKSIA